MKTIAFICCTLCVVINLDSVAGKQPIQTAPAPNIVFILADDLGWQDVACYDIDAPSPMETPHIDALAKKGIQFW
ncbi:MAG: sulfatase-like hydrolase/transferase, partial [Planctomycetaceae bacterium]|nr:sulfatase-like hydrolase/transferase [Planctomycetaceae bacterium]